jgi:hypothetical protein
LPTKKPGAKPAAFSHAKNIADLSAARWSTKRVTDLPAGHWPSKKLAAMSVKGAADVLGYEVLEVELVYRVVHYLRPEVRSHLLFSEKPKTTDIHSSFCGV